MMIEIGSCVMRFTHCFLLLFAMVRAAPSCAARKRKSLLLALNTSGGYFARMFLSWDNSPITSCLEKRNFVILSVDKTI